MSSHKITFKTIGLFVFLFGCVGYVLGTVTLLGPVRWITDALRASEAGEGKERIAVLAIIAALVGLSALFAALCARMVLRTTAAQVRFGVPVLALVAAILCVWVWMTPSLMRSGTEEVTIASVERPAPAVQPTMLTPEPVDAAAAPSAAPTAPVPTPQPQPAARPAGTHFTFGPYPERARLTALKAEGYDGVVSLLHPAVVPFEPKLLAEEKATAREVGITLHHLPMLPWVGDNEASLELLRELASKPGRYYVHCYLGRDRVRLAQAVVARAIEDADAVSIADGMQTRRTIAEKERFERGAIVRLADDAYLTPYPTDEEFAAWVIPEQWGSVVTLLDPDVESKVKWITKEREVLARYGIELIEMPIRAAELDPAETLRTVEAIRRLPRPLLVHDFLGASSGKAPAAELFLAAWQSGLPPVRATPFTRTGAHVLAANLVVGARPDFGAIGRHGIARVLSVGSGESEADRRAAEAAGLTFEQVDPQLQPDWAERLNAGGPWYVYGVEADAVAERIRPAGDA